MGTVVCATRGGEGSRAVQLKAIDIARTQKLGLVFLYVVDQAQVLEHDDVLKDAIHDELHWLARVSLNIAQQRAERAGISAEVVIRDGAVKDEIEAFLRHNEVSMLLLGAPRGTSPHFGDDAVERFAHTIEQDTGVPVSVVRPEDHQDLLDELRY